MTWFAPEAIIDKNQPVDLPVTDLGFVFSDPIQQKEWVYLLELQRLVILINENNDLSPIIADKLLLDET